MTKADTSKVYATLARMDPDMLPEGSVIIVINGKATLIVDDETGRPVPFADFVKRMQR